ncbi:MAG: hypothetical protein DRQ35_03120 [Gammaproteobacteria bacterium]|nr:MAG: hypothetical protein DRQ35_03120 [Gammaproteobacteria bacterium]
MAIPTYKVYIVQTRYKSVYDLRVPELFAEDCFEIRGEANVFSAAEECCRIATDSSEFNLQFFMTEDTNYKLLQATEFNDLS